MEGGAASAFTCGKEEEAVREDWCSVEKERPLLRFNSGIVNEENKTCPIRPELETCMVVSWGKERKKHFVTSGARGVSASCGAWRRGVANGLAQLKYRV